MNMRKIFAILLIIALAFGTVQAESDFSDEELKAMVLQPDYFVMFYNTVINEYLFKSFSSAQKNLLCLKYKGELAGLCAQYGNGSGDLSIDFNYDTNGEVNMLIANAYSNGNTNLRDAFIPLFLTLSVLLHDSEFLEWTSNMNDPVDIYYTDDYEIGYFHLEDHDSVAIVQRSTES